MASEPTHDLDALRQRLDRIDDALLDLVAERLEIVREVARHKMDRGTRLFRRRREEAMIRAKRREAERRGHDPDLIENLLRQLILASHGLQSAAVRETTAWTPRRIAVIGGKGAMGRFVGDVFRSLGHELLISDVDTSMTPEEAARAADLVVVSVPIAVTEEVIRRVGPCVRPEAGLMDVTSLKEAPVAWMLESTEAEVIGGHPMFSPAVESIHRQVVVLCRARGDAWADWVKRALESQGAEVVETTPAEHDRAMAVIQALRHAATIAFGKTLADLGVDIHETLRFTSPIYRLELIMVGRLFSQDPELYADLGLRNAYRGEVMDALEASVHAVADAVRRGDRDAFISEFRRIAAYFSDFSEQAMGESTYLLSRMVERM